MGNNRHKRKLVEVAILISTVGLMDEFNLCCKIYAENCT